MNREEYENYEIKYELKEVHEKLLEILTRFDRYCREHSICYSLADGTLLGMVRHQGFIPWDDDADVMVTREEYKKLVSSLSKEDEIVVFKVCFLDRVSTRTLMEEGYYVDLFINDVMPKSKLLFRAKVVVTGILRTYFYGNKVENVWHRDDSAFKTVLRELFTKLLGRIMALLYKKRDIFSVNDQIADIKKAEESEYYTRFTSRLYETKRRFNKISYNQGYKDVEFAGVKLMALKKSEVFLRDMYGDYEIMPPEEKRCPSHPVNMLDSIRKCYKYYN